MIVYHEFWSLNSGKFSRFSPRTSYSISPMSLEVVCTLDMGVAPLSTFIATKDTSFPPRQGCLFLMSKLLIVWSLKLLVFRADCNGFLERIPQQGCLEWYLWDWFGNNALGKRSLAKGIDIQSNIHRSESRWLATPKSWLGKGPW